MKKLLFTLFFVLGSMATALAENYPYRADYLWLTVPNHADWLYKTGERAKVEVSFSLYGMPQNVEVNYEGKTIDGKVFDSSYDRKQSATFRANQVIPGWTEALTHMPVGSKWEVVIPQEKAYGAREQREIKPFSALIFTIELLGIK